MEILENRAAWEAAYQTGWLAHYQQTGQLDWKLYNRPRNSQPVSGAGINLRQRRLVLIASAGAYLRETQTPFDAPNPLGDYSVRTFPVWTEFSQIAFAHDHYDHTAVNADPQVLLPLHHLDDLVAEGNLGDLAPRVINFSGYLPDVGRVLDETIPAILHEAHAQNARAALLVPA